MYRLSYKSRILVFSRRYSDSLQLSSGRNKNKSDGLSEMFRHWGLQILREYFLLFSSAYSGTWYKGDQQQCVWQGGVFERSTNQHPEIHLSTHIWQVPLMFTTKRCNGDCQHYINERCGLLIWGAQTVTVAPSFPASKKAQSLTIKKNKNRIYGSFKSLPWQRLGTWWCIYKPPQ